VPIIIQMVEGAKMSSRILIALSALTIVGGCSRTIARLQPAPGAMVVSGPGQGAAATAAGVRVTAHAQAWKWGPSDLDTKVTPLLIELENNGQMPALVRYNHFWLTDAQGHRFNAMPPYDVDGTVTEREVIENPYYGFSNFTLAPYLSRWYPRFALYRGAFAYDPVYYRPYLTTYRSIQLPTADMVQRALPEGVLAPGGRAAGFIYFQRLDRDIGTVTLNVEVVDANEGSTLGVARIPFEAK
jgi:hypothetical protein